MALTKYKIGDLIYETNRRNSALEFGLESVRGIANSKAIIRTKADVSNEAIVKFLIVNPKEFVYNPRTTRMGEKVGFGFNNTGAPLLFSFNNISFAVKPEMDNIIIPEYLFLFFNRGEFDRYAMINSWGSATELFTFSEMCDMDINLPPIEVQQKYVDLYNAMLENQKNYERGLEDLKLVCDGYIEELRRKMPCEPIGKYLQPCNTRNDDLSVTLAQGVDVNMQFIPAKREAEDKESTLVVRTGQFAFNKVVKCNGTKLPIALRNGADCIISGSYQVFEVKDKKSLLPDYLMLWMSRTETQRFCGFNSWGSTRDIFDFDALCQLEFPIPDIKIQQAIVKIYNQYTMRKEINEKLKAQIKNICPILIRGATEEA